ncbi:MAG: hypothetical protein HY330_04310 [Chloroflexi bacterium]|nr:hypothetical protein [Chloroflexota bacterium]
MLKKSPTQEQRTIHQPWKMRGRGDAAGRPAAAWGLRGAVTASARAVLLS